LRTLSRESAALRSVSQQHSDAIRHFRDFYSRYFAHPETSFGVAPSPTAYARQLLAEFGRK